MPKIDGILFDKDGTLFDFAATWTPWAEAFFLRLFDGDRAAAGALAQHLGFDLEARAFRPDSIAIAGTPADIVDHILPHMPGAKAQELIAIINEEAESAPMAEAVPLTPFLSGLRSQGLRLGVATNDGEAAARAHLGAVGVTQLFDFIVGFDSGFGGKPAPGQLLAFCDHTGLAPEACAMVGDSLHDLHAGRAAGFTTIGVLTGMAQAEDLQPAADVVLPNIGAIPDWLAQA